MSRLKFWILWSELLAFETSLEDCVLKNQMWEFELLNSEKDFIEVLRFATFVN